MPQTMAGPKIDTTPITDAFLPFVLDLMSSVTRCYPHQRVEFTVGADFLWGGLGYRVTTKASATTYKDWYELKITFGGVQQHDLQFLTDLKEGFVGLLTELLQLGIGDQKWDVADYDIANMGELKLTVVSVVDEADCVAPKP
jgi:hypothetical protein